MNFKQKFRLGLVLIVFFIGAGFIFLPHKASAATSASSPNDIFNCLKNISFANVAEIDCIFTPVGAGSKTTVKFIDPHPDDEVKNYQQQDPKFFCENGDVQDSSDSGTAGNKYYIGANVAGAGSTLTQDDAGNRLKIVFDEGYVNSSNNCVYPDGYNKDKLPNPPSSDGKIGGADTQKVAILLKFTSSGIGPLDGVTSGDLSNNWTLTSYSGPSNGLAFVNNYSPGDCNGDVILSNASTNVAYRYSLLEGGKSYSDLTAFMGDSTWGTTSCGQHDGKRNFFGTSTPIQIAGTPPSGPAANNVPGNVPKLANNASCEANFFTFGWVICPALGLADNATGTFNSFVEDQLCFQTGPTGQKSSTGQTDCGGKNNLNNQVKDSWAIFKNIATALLVVVLLVAIISQAFGGGPLDAYAIRKLLPKVIAAVILMQLSWYLFKWLIDLSNDAGFGIRDLLLAPFGGEANVSIDKLTGVAFGANNPGGNDTIGFFTLLAAGITSYIVSIPTLALLALYVVLALFTAFLVLVFRKLLIILLVILAPVGLILWILPGTENYWKMWKDNFTKLLLMFPLIMGLIAAGKIFSAVTAGNASSSMFNPHLAVVHLGPLPVPYLGASVSSFVELFIVIAAYFAPYFLLPKTFSWGGAAMGALAKGSHAFMEKTSKPAKDYLQWRQGLAPWKQARAARKAEVERRAKLDFARHLQDEGVMGTIRRGRLAGIGGLRRERAIRQAITRAGEERMREEEIKEEALQLANEQITEDDTGTSGARLNPNLRGERYADLARNDKLRFLEHHARNTTDPYRRQVLLAEMANLRGTRELYRVRNHMLANGQGAEFNRAVQRNFEAFNSSSPIFTAGATQTMVTAAETARAAAVRAGLSPDQVDDAVATSLLGEDLGYMRGQNDQTIATQSGGGWELYHDMAAAEDTGMTVRDVAAARTTPGGTIPRGTGARQDEVAGTYQRIMTSGQPYTGNVSPSAHTIWRGGLPPPPGPGAARPAPTVPTGSRSEEIITMSDTDVLRMLRRAARDAAAAGRVHPVTGAPLTGWEALSNSDLLRIYNYRTGTIKAEAERELRNRRLFP